MVPWESSEEFMDGQLAFPLGAHSSGKSFEPLPGSQKFCRVQSLPRVLAGVKENQSQSVSSDQYANECKVMDCESGVHMFGETQSETDGSKTLDDE